MQRQVAADVLAQAGWVTGVFHVPMRTAMLATLNKKSEFLPLTDVVTEPGAEPIEFLAVRKSAVLVIVPKDADDVDAFMPSHPDEIRICCLLDHATVEGTVRILGGQRTSDFLETNPGFVVLTNCSLSTEQGGDREGVPQVIVNMAHVQGVMEASVASRRARAPALAAR